MSQENNSSSLFEQLRQAESDFAAAQAHLESLRAQMQNEQSQPYSQPYMPPYGVSPMGNQADYWQNTPPNPQQIPQPQDYPHAQPFTAPYYGAPIPPMPGQPNGIPMGYATKDHIAAGLLAIFLGTLGIHKFYLGYNTAGFIMLAITVIGGLFFGLGTLVMVVVSFIEGILYLTKTQTEFERMYLMQERQWF